MEEEEGRRSGELSHRAIDGASEGKSQPVIKNKNLGIRLWGFKSWFYQSQAVELWANGLTCDLISLSII